MHLIVSILKCFTALKAKQDYGYVLYCIEGFIFHKYTGRVIVNHMHGRARYNATRRIKHVTPPQNIKYHTTMHNREKGSRANSPCQILIKQKCCEGKRPAHHNTDDVGVGVVGTRSPRHVPAATPAWAARLQHGTALRLHTRDTRERAVTRHASRGMERRGKKKTPTRVWASRSESEREV